MALAVAVPVVVEEAGALVLSLLSLSGANRATPAAEGRGRTMADRALAQVESPAGVGGVG